ncbi:MAG: uracil phosphoribosyltransferase [Calditrichaeota bacterium]|nr:MAG: uracil phosphoribosyltransferase [Calditrichota bacterium]
MAEQLRVIDHPLIHHNLTILRDAATPPAEFRRRLRHICQLMLPEVTADLPTRETTVQTPLEPAAARQIGARIVVVSILRAGLGMQDALIDLLPEAVSGHLGFYRNEKTLQPVQYYVNLPRDLHESYVILCDPMLATGGSLHAALTLLKRGGARNLRCLTLVAAPEGVKCLREGHPDVPVFTAVLDRQLNERGYILPGLGDAGDRQFGTL